jgi:hypothetical protein
MLYRQIQHNQNLHVYLLLFLLKNPSYKRKAGTARISHYSPLTIHYYYIII